MLNKCMLNEDHSRFKKLFIYSTVTEHLQCAVVHVKTRPVAQIHRLEQTKLDSGLFSNLIKELNYF